MSPLSSQSKLLILRTVFQHQRPSTSFPVNRSFSTSRSYSTSQSTTTSTRISRETLHRLHRLSALNPPPPDSSEEGELIDELSELISLMDEVKQMELPHSLEERADLLNQGVFGEVTISQESLDRLDKIRQLGNGQVEDKARERSGKQLLDWSTNRLGDYYASKK
ncbi:hypothetical protein L486_05664 [Kwoniella mangroviensis CBS 10435]|uniref:Uncharacterized protein n=1 Tax=Kwoniella mangroviensis CBS 10435 TaxID=1331196 RepID=A0A1B9IMK4_9TREE|nr:uncharacterized protein I203_07311 [Kwoniella mangroviensis CBS 8507]OCF56809.1 hypothetical protein L486_05664 [Kwoniella mangroviensis CBS 10435]OCF63613.1 hypothetical protein I203_07311 [Kwoniella mangroviensis CBS 8507]OCF75379.1 hypothetical protein I204_04234 [Kwoniella mangroviensis CBS 8886]